MAKEKKMWVYIFLNQNLMGIKGYDKCFIYFRYKITMRFFGWGTSGTYLRESEFYKCGHTYRGFTK